MMNSEDQAMIEPGIGLFQVQASERILLLSSGPTARILAGRFLARKKRTRPYPARIYRMKRNQVEIDLVGPAMGAPIAGMVLEQLISGGARKIIVLGFAGSIDPSLKIGDLVLVKEAISDEGTTQNYFPDLKTVLASEALLAATASEMGLRGEKIQAGNVVSTDGFFRETREKIERFRRQGAIAIEMELSALYAIARYRGVELLGMAIISDEMFGGKWNSGFKSPKLIWSLLRAGEMALSVLSK